ncbi:MAG: flagellar biosynthetic protein FliO, partial [Gammaproteobacteria bacterium]|nr:flagellar biosynthetic protein FliO [Gammaproteobacteria bacterium]
PCSNNIMNNFFQKISYLLLFLPQLVSAVTEEKTLPVDPLSASSIANMLMGLGLVLAIIFVMAWVVKRMGGMQLAGSQRLKVLAGLSVGTREKVVLIQVENKRIVLGVAQGQVNTLHVLDGEYENNEAESFNTGADFKDKLIQALSKTIKSKTNEK